MSADQSNIVHLPYTCSALGVDHADGEIVVRYN